MQLLPLNRASRHRRVPWIFLLCCVAGGWSAVLADTGAGKTRPEVVFVRSYGEGRTNYDFKEGVMIGTDELIVGAECFVPDPQAPPSTEICLWSVGAGDGRATPIHFELPPKPPGRHRGFALLELAGLAPGDEPEEILAFPVALQRPWLWRIHRGSPGVVVKEIVPASPDPEDEILIGRVVRQAGGFLLLGTEDSTAVMMKIDGSGGLVWKKRIKEGRMAEARDAVPLEGGGLLLLVESGGQGVVSLGRSRLSLLACDAQGDVKLERRVSGRNGSLARSGRNRNVLVYDKGGSGERDVRVRALDDRLEDVWEIPLVGEESDNPLRFAITPSRDGGVNVAGEKDRVPYVARLDMNGQVIWSVTGTGMHPGDNYQVLESPAGIFVLSTEFVTGATRVRAIRLKE